MIRKVNLADSKAICDIYNYYISNTTITFEEAQVTQEEMNNRIKDISSKLPWIVYECDGVVVGYAYATIWKARSAYRYSAELSVYIDVNHKRRGIGSELYRYVIELLRDREFHSAIGGIALPNSASVRLHEKLGFKKVAHFEQIGFKQNTWIDVGYWQLFLN
ncbi:MAG: GNAT family N-acetyltransferase [Clostridia bacterium]|nr:GNAT family N-acetyltransferase [Clostridia bacterium]